MRFGKIVALAAAAGLPSAGVPAADEIRWHSMPVRSRTEAELGLPGGEAEQHLQGMTRAASRPDRIYLSHDCGQVWRSDDNGRTWRHTICRGLHVAAGQSIEADPVNADVLFIIVSRAWDYLSRDMQGLYRSEDAGATWTRVLKLDEVDPQRSMQRAITWDPSSLDGREARRWYAGFAGQSMYRSDDGGRTWSRAGSLEEHRPLHVVAAHPTRPGVLYLGSQRGLFLSEDRGAGFLPLGDLPKGGVRSVEIDRANPLDIHATVDGVGLFRSCDGGRRFSRILQFDAQYAVVHPTDRGRIHLVGRNGAHMRTSRDGGATWETPKVVPIPGWDREGSSWKSKFNGEFSALLPDPRDPDSAVGIANATLYRTGDGGRTFTDSSAGFTGYAWGWFTHPVAFDRADPLRFAFFCYDVGAVVTTNGGLWFERAPVPWVWKRDRKIEHTGMYAGDFQPAPGSRVVVASAGGYWNQVLVRSEDAGGTWTIVEPKARQNLFVAFHAKDPGVVYADDKRSDDAGRTFHRMPALPANAAIVGMSPSRPDTIYAMDERRTELIRSDDRGETWRLYNRPGWAMRRLDSKPTFAVCPGNPDRVYSVDARGDLAVFDGTSWRNLGVLALAGGEKEQRNFVRAVAIDPRHPEVVYAGCHAPGRPFLFRSTDAGGTWTDISGDVPHIGVGGLVVHPLTGDVFSGGVTGTRLLPPPYASPASVCERLSSP